MVIGTCTDFSELSVGAIACVALITCTSKKNHTALQIQLAFQHNARVTCATIPAFENVSEW